MKKRRSAILMGWILTLVFSHAAALARDGMPRQKRRVGSKAKIAHQDELYREVLKRLELAEKRAQEAETAAANAASETRLAREQAAQATADARRANDTLAEMRELVASLQRNTEHTARETTALNRLDEQIAANVKAARGVEDSNAKKIAVLEQRVEGVASPPKSPIKFYGNILANATLADRGSNTVDVPLFAQKRTLSPDQNHQNFNMTVRQSRFGLRYEGSIFKTAKLTGVFEFDLFGGNPAFSNGVNFDLFRVRHAYGRIDWEKDSFEAGQDWAVFMPLNPTTLASYAITGFSTSGNLWIRSPQIRYEHREGRKTRFIFTAALLDPNAGDNPGAAGPRGIGLGERASLPAFESRMGLAAPTHGHESSVGISGRYSRLLGVPGNPAGTIERSPIDSYGVGGDWNIWLSSGFRVTGEAFQGRALGIFSGNIAQSAVVLAGRARGINSTGGWLELHGEAPAGYEGAWKKFSANLGYGIEDNRSRDLLAGLRKRNQTYLINGQYRYSPNFTMALEYRRIHTDFFEQRAANQRLNWVSLAFLYSF
ncbi:MAG TPA: hypothetical protein VJ302_14585 [Blastocatellia bacterium]|nr:hypothetical protein [Blastocatellia bacterium]